MTALKRLFGDGSRVFFLAAGLWMGAFALFTGALWPAMTGLRVPHRKAGAAP